MILLPSWSLFVKTTPEGFKDMCTQLGTDPDVSTCDTPILRKMFRDPKPNQWKIPEKDLVDEIIFRTINSRNRIMLELMARGGMRIGEVLKITPSDMDDRKLIIREPKSGKGTEVVFIPQKV